MSPRPTIDAEDRAAAQALAPALDSLDDVRMRQRIHAQLFDSEDAGVWIDRFELVEKLGAGGMGSVWEAKDHRLHRRVALKFLRSRTQASPTQDRRLFREAQALARIQHPNVVAVYDVGRHEGRVWIAMELVPGQTLQAWRDARAPSHDQLLAVWLAAGRGLAAIHAAGLVHRDIKPSNILLGDDGRARVVDFGLVCAARSSAVTLASEAGSEVSTSENADTIAEPLTQTGGFVGTPAYAAPEQLRGQAVDARSDQYALCVCVWEALTGARPSLAAKPQAGRLPRRVHDALQRGLAEDPSRRHASVAQLLDALAPPRPRWPLPVALTAVLGVGVGAASFALLDDDAPAPPVCADAGVSFDARWGADQRDALAATLGAGPVSAFLLPALDDWSARWRQASVEACTQTLVEQRRSAATLDQRTRCLERQAETFSFVIDALGRGPMSAERARTSVALFQDPRDCLRPEGDGLDQLSPEALAEHRDLDQARLRLSLDHRNRKLATRREQAQQLRQRARLASFTTLESRLALLEGRLASFAGDGPAAERHLSEVLDLGERLDLDDLRAMAWLELSRVALDLDLDRELARWYWRRAQPLLAHARPETRAASYWSAARIELSAGQLDGASDALDAAVEAYEAIGPRASHGLAACLRLQSTIAATRQDEHAVERLLARVTEVELRANAAVPVADARSGEALVGEAIDLIEVGKLDAASTAIDRAIDQLRREHGPGIELAAAHVTRSAIADARGQLDEALEQALLADEMIREHGGAEHFERYTALSALGVAAFRGQRFDQADVAFTRALRIVDRHYDADAPELAMPMINLAEARHARGLHREAERLLLDALPRLQAALGPDHPDCAIAHKALGAVHLALGRGPEAVSELERAAALHEAHLRNGSEAAETTWLLAEALAATGDATRARREASHARAQFTALGDDFSPRTIEIDDWLTRQQKGPRP